MKKSEKIEIRISPEDKEALAKRAEAEGRPASEVVRDLLQSGGVTAQAETVPEGPPRSLRFAFGGGLFVIGVLLGAVTGGLIGAPNRLPGVVDVGFTVRIPPASDVYGTDTILDTHGTVPLSALDGAAFLIADGPQSGYELSIVREGEADAPRVLSLNVCRRTSDGCAPLATSTLTSVLMGTAADTEALGPSGETFYIDLVGRVLDDS